MGLETALETKLQYPYKISIEETTTYRIGPRSIKNARPETGLENSCHVTHARNEIPGLS